MTIPISTVHNTSHAPAISLCDFRFSWKRREPLLLDIATLDVARGEKVFLYGSSGSGKTTLLNLLAGIIPPQGGKLEVLGQNFNGLSQRHRDKFRARHIGVIFQQFNLIPYLSLLDNVLLGAHFAGVAASPRTRAHHLLAELGLAQELFQRPACQLSVGQQQRGAVARALMASPEIVIADEPTSALDSDSREAFMKLLLQSQTTLATTVIFVSHDKSLQSYFSRAIDMRDFSPQVNTVEERVHAD